MARFIHILRDVNFGATRWFTWTSVSSSLLLSPWRRPVEEGLHATLKSPSLYHQASTLAPTAPKRRLLDMASVPMFKIPGREVPKDRTADAGWMDACSSADGPAINEGGVSQGGSESRLSDKRRGSTEEHHDGKIAASHRDQTIDWREVLHRARAEAKHEAQRGGTTAILMDSFKRMHTYLRISLTERCNLRCQYCMPAEGIRLTEEGRLLTSREVLRLAKLFVDAGVTKIRLTGGEPTVRPDLVQLCQGLSGLDGLETLAMTSNGIKLERQLPELKAAGLTALNISLDTLQASRFEELTRRKGHSRVLKAIKAAIQLGYEPVKINVVLMRGVNDDEIPAFVAMTKDKPVNVRFIEYMPFDGNVWSDKKMVPYKEMRQRVDEAVALLLPGRPGLGTERPDAQQQQQAALERLADPRGEVAKNFRVPGFHGSVSFITSMTTHFCGECNRLRLLADGSLKVCLFGANEVSLRDAMRGGATDDDLRLIIGAALRRKKAAHAGMKELAVTGNRPMIAIGG